MKKLKVIKTFADKVITYKTYRVGEIISLPDERANDAINKGLAVEVAETKVEAESEAEVEAKPTRKKAAKKKG